VKGDAADSDSTKNETSERGQSNVAVDGFRVTVWGRQPGPGSSYSSPNNASKPGK